MHNWVSGHFDCDSRLTEATERNDGHRESITRYARRSYYHSMFRFWWKRNGLPPFLEKQSSSKEIVQCVSTSVSHDRPPNGHSFTRVFCLSFKRYASQTRQCLGKQDFLPCCLVGLAFIYAKRCVSLHLPGAYLQTLVCCGSTSSLHVQFPQKALRCHFFGHLLTCHILDTTQILRSRLRRKPAQLLFVES